MIARKPQSRMGSGRVGLLLCLVVACGWMQESAYADRPEPVVVTNPVTVANPVSTVTVGNSSPIPVTVTNALPAPNANDPAKTAFGNAFGFGVVAGSSSASVPLAQVPVGKRLVVELVSLWCSALPGTFPIRAAVFVGQKVTGGINPFVTQAFNIALQNQGVDAAGTQYFAGSLAGRMYADDIAGSSSDVDLIVFQSNSASSMACSVSFSGYLVTL
jgi:hypothetical protein